MSMETSCPSGPQPVSEGRGIHCGVDLEAISQGCRWLWRYCAQLVRNQKFLPTICRYLRSINGDNHQLLGIRTTSMEEVCFQSPKKGKPNHDQRCAPQDVSSECLQNPVILLVVSARICAARPCAYECAPVMRAHAAGTCL